MDKETNAKYSDIDIGIEGKKIPVGTYYKILDELEESDLPYRVELVEFKKTAKDKIIPLELR